MEPVLSFIVAVAAGGIEKPRELRSLGFSFCVSNTGAFFLPNGIIAYAENLFKIPFGRKEML